MMVTCSTSADILRWNVTVPLSQTRRVFQRQLSHIGTIQMVMPIMTALTTLNVSRSLNNSWPLPLVSTIFTDNATADLNRTYYDLLSSIKAEWGSSSGKCKC